MRINPPDPPAVQPLPLDNAQNFLVLCGLRFGQRLKERQDLLPIAQSSARQLTYDERMGEHVSVRQERLQLAVSYAQVVDPDGGIDEDHTAWPGRRRRPALNRGSVPPSFANRRALSRAINASRPMRTRAVFLETPVNRVARRRRIGSMFKVVRIYAL
jgi:hypothetical protein